MGGILNNKQKGAVKFSMIRRINALRPDHKDYMYWLRLLLAQHLWQNVR